jgi:hypothetical protein
VLRKSHGDAEVEGSRHGDTDLFVENISLGETRLYIDRLRENLAWYQQLYGNG